LKKLGPESKERLELSPPPFNGRCGWTETKWVYIKENDIAKLLTP
jgi:hypothetical protein